MQPLILQNNDIRQVTLRGAGMYCFQPKLSYNPHSDEEWIKRRDALEKRLQEAHIRLALEETGGDAA